MIEVPQEKEYKLVGGTNRQFKFQMSDDNANLFDKARVLAELIGLQVGSPARIDIADTYYDDADQALAKQKCSVRIRLENGKQLLTVKAKPGSSVSSALERPEHEIELSAAEKKRLESCGFKTLADDVFLTILKRTCHFKDLHPVVTVRNDRLQAELKTPAAASYKLCLDRYFFKTPDGDESGIGHEIEIEEQSLGISSPAGVHDADLERYIGFLERFFDYEGTKTSKVQRGIEWILKKDSALKKTIMVAFFDIVGYSKLSPEVQRRVVQRFGRSVKSAVQAVGLNHAKNAYIPTGDGMILILEDHSEKLLPLVIAVQKSVKHQNAMFTGESYSFRTGLHVGPVFTYSDINDVENYAGSGINLAQRVMAFGDDWHILVSEEGYKYTGGMYEGQKSYFHSIGTRQIKHGEEMKVYNIYSHEDEFGNVVTPS